MFTFDKRDEGYLVSKDGHTVADIRTQTIGETIDPRLRVQDRTVTPIPRDQWLVHFTARRLTPPELTTLCEQIAALAE